MHLSVTLPLLLLLPFGLAHGSPLRHAHHPSRRSQRQRSTESLSVTKRAGLLSDLTGDDSNSTAIASTSAASASAVKSTALSTAIDHDATSSSAVLTSATAASTPATVLSTGTTILSSSAISTSALSGGTTAKGLNSTSSASLASSAGAMNSSVLATATVTSAAAQSSLASSMASSDAAIQYTTDAAGQTQLITVILTQSAVGADASSSASAASVTTTASGGGDSISTPAIIGISIAVGVVVISLIACAIWRMKRRSSDEDEAIRWPELNRHGDSTVHHALPARQTGQHGFETNPLERSISNSSSLFSPSTLAAPHSAVPMALNGSSFGAASSLDDDYLSEKYAGGPASHDDHDNYTSFPPPVQMEQTPSIGGTGVYGTSQDEHDHEADMYGQMTMANAHGHSQHVTYPSGPASTDQVHGSGARYRIE